MLTYGRAKIRKALGFFQIDLLKCVKLVIVSCIKNVSPFPFLYVVLATPPELQQFITQPSYELMRLRDDFITKVSWNNPNSTEAAK